MTRVSEKWLSEHPYAQTLLDFLWGRLQRRTQSLYNDCILLRPTEIVLTDDDSKNPLFPRGVFKKTLLELSDRRFISISEVASRKSGEMVVSVLCGPSPPMKKIPRFRFKGFPETKCKIEGCDAPVWPSIEQGLCHLHFLRNKRGKMAPDGRLIKKGSIEEKFKDDRAAYIYKVLVMFEKKINTLVKNMPLIEMRKAGHTYTEIGAHFSLSHERARQIVLEFSSEKPRRSIRTGKQK